MSAPEETVQGTAADVALKAEPVVVATDEPKKADDTPAPVVDDAAKATEDARLAEEAKKVAEGAATKVEPTASEGAEARIRKLIGEREEAKRQAEYFRGLSEGRGPKPEVPAALAPMRIEDFLPTEQEFAAVGLTADAFEKAGRSYDDLLIAKSAFATRKASALMAKQAEETRAKESVAKSQSTFMERVNKAAETDPGILDLMEDRTLPVSQAMAEVIRESEVAPKILRFIADNRAEGKRIAGLPPLAAARELGRIEAKIMATPAPEPPKRVSQAPEPIRSLTPSGVTEIDLDKVPIDDFMKKRNAQQFGAARS
ncbi:hypothetical protein M0Q28_06720 [Patescibacteria group bacterium]|jgi:hypothetical protein|nr:hypothetical protein [Patescibacteria group bacterium]